MMMQSVSSAVVSGSQVSHFDSVLLIQSAAVEVSELTWTARILIDSLAHRFSLNFYWVCTHYFALEY
jgi:hypothetical protein